MPQRGCDRCGKAYEAQRPRSRWCSSDCRVAAGRARAAGLPERIAPVVVDLDAPVAEPSAGPVELATRARLEAVDRLDGPVGQGCVAAARTIDSPSTPPSAMAGLLKELRASLEVALVGVGREADLVDELKARRERRGA